MKLNNITITNFIDLTPGNKLMVLEWRNNHNVKKWMYTSDPISIEDHLAFIELLKKDTTKQYFLVTDNKAYIGVIYFINIDKKAEFGLYSNPNTKGNGTILMDTICEYAFNILNLTILKAEVFSHNIKAINLYKRYGFLEVDSNIIKSQKIIYMELKNEH